MNVTALEIQAALQSCEVCPSQYPNEYDGIVKTTQMYIDGSKQGKSEVMRSAFHPDASFFGYAGEQLAVGTKFLFDWIDKNGPPPNIEPRVVSVDILDSIAVVRLEVDGCCQSVCKLLHLDRVFRSDIVCCRIPQT